MFLVSYLQRKEDTMMTRIKDAEHSQSIAEMRQRIAELEIEVRTLKYEKSNIL